MIFTDRYRQICLITRVCWFSKLSQYWLILQGQRYKLIREKSLYKIYTGEHSPWLDGCRVNMRCMQLLILHHRTKDHRVQLWAQAEQSPVEKKKGIFHLQWEAESTALLQRTAKMLMSQRHRIYNGVTIIHTKPMQRTANTESSMWNKDIAEVQPYWLNDEWSHSYRVVQHAKDKFVWSRYSIF